MTVIIALDFLSAPCVVLFRITRETHARNLATLADRRSSASEVQVSV